METMNKNLMAKASVRIHAPVSKVWDALTNPELIKKYFFGTVVVSKWKAGSPIVFRGEWDGKPYEDKGTILDFAPNKLFRYNYWSSIGGTPDRPENYATITNQLWEENGVTVLSITQDKIESEERKNQSVQNWEMVLTAMKDMIEKTT